MNDRLNLVVFAGYRRNILYHALKYYQEFVDDIFLVVHPDDSDPEFMPWIQDIVDRLGIKIHSTLGSRRCDWNFHTASMYDIRQQRPDEWWVLTDDDELQVYPMPLREILKEANKYKFTHMLGAHLDRVGEDGNLVEIELDSDLDQSCPNAGVLGAFLGHTPHKVVVCKGFVKTCSGQHFAEAPYAFNPRRRARLQPNRAAFPQSRAFTQVHHFKWGHNLPTIVGEIVETVDSMPFNEGISQLKKYLDSTGNRIDLMDERCKWVRTASSNFSDYPHWQFFQDKQFYPIHWDKFFGVK